MEGIGRAKAQQYHPVHCGTMHLSEAKDVQYTIGNVSIIREHATVCSRGERYQWRRMHRSACFICIYAVAFNVRKKVKKWCNYSR